jgi:hypothetical protein
MRIASGGNVGIGTTVPESMLETYNDEVQVSSSGASCTGTNAGALRYSAGTLSYCNGTAWTASSSGGSSSSATAWALIQSTDIATAATSYTFSGLSGDTDLEYQIIARVVSGATSTSTSVVVNGDTTTTDYGYQYVSGVGSTAGASQITSYDGLFLGTAGTIGQIGFAHATLYAKSGKARTMLDSYSQAINGTTIGGDVQMASVWTNTASPITSLQILATQTNGLGVGTHLELWALRTVGGGSGVSGVTLGTSSTVTNPQKNADVTTGLYSDATGTVEISSAGTQSFSSSSTQTLIPVGNVGIGTSGPHSKLEVNGSIINTTAYANNVNLSAYDLGVGTIGAGASIYSYGPICTGNSSAVCTGTSGVVIGVADTSATVNIPNTGNAFFNGGNVGIGTTVPTTPLQIRTAANEDLVFRGSIVSGATTGAEIGAVNDNNSVWEPLELDGSITILGMAGKVGIGTTSPDSLLTVSANTTGTPALPINTVLHVVGTNGSYARALIDTFGSISGGVLSLRGAEGTAAAPTASQIGDNLGQVGAYGYGTTGYSTLSRAAITFQAEQTWTDTAQGTYMVFVTTPDGTITPAERMRISAAGGVGIGTWLPVASSLTINGTLLTSATTNTSNGVLVIQAGAYTANDYTAIDFMPTNATVPYARISMLETGSGSSLVFNTSNNFTTGLTNTALTLDTTGNVHAGTSFVSNMPGTHGAATNVCFSGTGFFDSCSSLRKFKKDIQPLTLGLDTVMQLQPVSYKWKATGEPDIGFIAEDTVTVDPILGEKGTTGKLTGVRYAHMVALLTKAIQQLKVMFDADHDAIAELKADNDNLRAANDNEAAQIKALTARLDAFEAARR